MGSTLSNSLQTFPFFFRYDGRALLEGFAEVFPSVEQSSSVMFGLIATLPPSMFKLEDDPAEVGQPAPAPPGIPQVAGEARSAVQFNSVPCITHSMVNLWITKISKTHEVYHPPHTLNPGVTSLSSDVSVLTGSPSFGGCWAC